MLNEDTYSSDHLAIILELGRQKPQGLKKFRFENCWIGNPEYFEVSREGWGKNKGCEITQQIVTCAQDLADWGRRHR